MDVGIDTGKTNPFESGIHPMTTRRRGSVDPTSLHKTYEETSFGGDASETEQLLRRMESVDSALKNIEDAWSEIKKKYPKINPLKAPFTARIADYDRIMVRRNTN